MRQAWLSNYSVSITTHLLLLMNCIFNDDAINNERTAKSKEGRAETIWETNPVKQFVPCFKRCPGKKHIEGTKRCYLENVILQWGKKKIAQSHGWKMNTEL